MIAIPSTAPAAVAAATPPLIGPFLIPVTLDTLF
jgi:hypothetical protein